MRKYCYLLLTALVLAGCGSYKDVVYLQDVKDGDAVALGASHEVTIQPSDVLNIIVSTVNSSDAELVKPFNLMPLTSGGSFAGSVADTPVQGYLVDSEGYITYPTFGKLHVGGMTRNELINFLTQKLVDSEQLKEPIVSVAFLNLKVNIMGEVARPGSYAITSNRMTLLDALSMAGDLTIYGRRDKLLIIREEDGQRKNAYVNLKSKDLFSSPYFYLKQNDVVYVLPNKRKADQSVVSPWITPILSGVGTLASIASVITMSIYYTKVASK